MKLPVASAAVCDMQCPMRSAPHMCALKQGSLLCMYVAPLCIPLQPGMMLKTGMQWNCQPSFLIRSMYMF